MPIFKHPCPHCGKFINRDVAACPFCATKDPFAPARCPNCRTVIDDPSWAACPRCGQSLTAAAAAPAPDRIPSPNQPPPEAYLNPNSPPPAPSPQPGPPPAAPATAPSSAVGAAAAKCTGCGAPLAPGARFCTVCGTLAG